MFVVCLFVFLGPLTETIVSRQEITFKEKQKNFSKRCLNQIEVKLEEISLKVKDTVEES